jgi:hypothetical protein
MCPHFLLGQLLQCLQIDLLDEPTMQPHLGIEQLFRQQRIGWRRRRLRRIV